MIYIKLVINEFRVLKNIWILTSYFTILFIFNIFKIIILQVALIIGYFFNFNFIYLVSIRVY